MTSPIRTSRPLAAVFALSLALLAALPARATTFVKDVMVIGGTKAEISSQTNSLLPQGWTFVNYDLNKGASGDYIYLLYQAEADTSGDRDYVTGFYIKSGSTGVSNTLTYAGRTYTLAPYAGGSHFKSQKGDLNSNAGGASIHLYYTKAPISGRAVSSVTFNATSDGAVPWNGNGEPADLNDDCGGGTAYIYMHVSTSLVTYALTYDLAGGSLPLANPSTYTAVSSAITLNNPVRTGFTFVGWTWDGQSNPVKTVTLPQGSTGNRSFVANWSLVNYRLTYDLSGGSLPDGASNPSTYHVLTPTFTLANPVLPGHTFVGWTWTGQSTPVKPVTIAKGSTGDRSFVAKFSLDTYPIVYDLAEGAFPDGSSAPTSYTFETPTFSLVTPVRPGYTFLGWTWTGQSTPVATVTIPQGSTGQKSYSANWSLDTYALTYDLGGGALSGGASNPASYTVETPTFTLANPTRSGYVFTGWTWDGQSTPTKTVTLPQGFTGDKAFVANWSITPVGRIDTCEGGAGQFTVVGWAYDPDVPSQSISVQVKVYQADGSTLVTQQTFAADRPRDDVNSAYHITGQHGYSATIDGLDAGSYKVKVYALDTNGGNNPQLGSTQTVSITPGPITVTIGNGTVHYSMPFDTFYSYSLSQQIYTATEIGTAGTITSIAFNYAGTAPFSLSGVQVFLKHTDKNVFESSTNVVSVTSADKVFEGSFSATDAGWASITLDTPFEYDGNGNLLVCCLDPTDGKPGNVPFYLHEAGNNKVIKASNDDYVPELDGSNWFSHDDYLYELDTKGPEEFQLLRPVISLSDAARNNIRIGISPYDSFAKPENLAVGGLTDTNATLSWTAPETTNTITGYAWQYRKASEASWSAETTTTATSASLDGLTGDTDYEFRVKTLYGSDASLYATFSFVTATPLPYECGFENGMDHWSMVDVNRGWTGIDMAAKHDGDSGFQFYQFSEAQGKKPQYLISPRFAGNVPMTVLFYYSTDNFSSGEKFQVGYSTTTSDVGAFTWGDEIAVISGYSVGDGGVVTAVVSWNLYENTFPADVKYMAVKYVSNNYRLFLDDFTFLANVGPKPANLAVSGLTDTNAVLIWTAPETTNTITGYAWQYKKASDASWSAETATTGTSASLDGLTGDTDYDFRVKTFYGSDASLYATFSFITATSLPYECGFENGMERWGMVDCNIDWAAGVDYLLYTGIRTQAKHEGEVGFQFDHFTESEGKKPQYLISPCFPGISAMVVSFHYKNYTWNNPETFQVGCSTTTSDVDAFTWGEEIAVSGERWSKFEQVFPAGTRFVAVKYISNNRRLFLDDFSFEAYSPYAKPSDLAVGILTDTNASLTWMAPDGSPTGYAWQCRKSGDADWSAETAVAGTSATFDGLTANTAYDFRVKAVYGNDKASNFATVRFMTEGPMMSLPYADGFEGGLGGWRVVEGMTATGISPNNVYNGSNGFMFQVDNDQNPQYLMSPWFDGSSAMNVTFWYRNYEEATHTYPAHFQVGYSTTTRDPAAFTWGEETGSSYEWQQYAASFPAGTKFVAVKWTSGYLLYLDDFSFTVSYGPKPADLSISTCTEETATLTWTAPETANTITGYAWQYKKASDASWSAETATTGTSASLDGLTADTAYEFRVKTLYGDEASTYATLSFSTVVTLPYECGFEEGLGNWCRVDCLIDPSSPVYTEEHTGISSLSGNAHAGDHSFVFSPWTSAHQYLVSPRLLGNVPVAVAFHYKNGKDANDIGYPAFFQVGSSTTTGDIDAFTWGDVIETLAPWQQFAQVYPAGTRFVAIRWLVKSDRYSSYYMYLDDFSFTGLAYTYADWAADHGITGAWDAKDGDGVANVFRYLFGKPTGAFDAPPLLAIEPTADGHLVAHTPELVNTNGFTCALSSADDPTGTQNPTSHPLDSDGETVIDEPETGSRTRFYRLKARPE